MKKIDQLMEERKSARDFDPDFKINEGDWEMIMNAIRLAPNSHGILNYRVLVLPKSTFRDQLNELFYQQKNFSNSSIYLIFVAKTGLAIKNQSIYEIAELIFPEPEKEELRKEYVTRFQKTFEKRFNDQPILADEWSAKQTYIGAGIGTLAAASVDIDTCIQEGVDFVKLTEFLQNHQLIKQDEKAILGMAFGRAIPSEFKKTKIRKKMSDFAKLVD